MNEVQITQGEKLITTPPTKKDFRVNTPIATQRTYDYLHIEGHRSIGGQAHPDIEIPIGEDGKINFGDGMTVVEGEFAFRTLGEYQNWIFRDEFREFTKEEKSRIFLKPGDYNAEDSLRKEPRREGAKTLFGGYDEAFKAGKTVLDLGSGEAIALMQLAREFPNTSFIGVDHLYFDKTENPKDPDEPFYSPAKRQLYPGKPGLQLTNSDWLNLDGIPDNSVDTIISVQALGMWGFPNGHHRGTEENGKKMIDAITRVAKPGAILRVSENMKFFEENMDPREWKIYRSEESVVARKRRSGLVGILDTLAERKQQRGEIASAKS